MPCPIPADQVKVLMDKYGLTNTNLYIESGANYGKRVMKPAPSAETFKAAAAMYLRNAYR